MLAPQRRDSGGGEKGGETLCNGLQHLKEVQQADSIVNSHQYINQSTTKDVPRAGDHQESSPCKPTGVQSLTSQNEQLRPVSQEPLKNPKSSSRDLLSVLVKPSGSLQSGRPENSCNPRLASSGSTGAKTPEELAHTHVKSEEDRREGRETAEHLINPEPAQARSGSLRSSTLRSIATGSLASFRRKRSQLKPWPNPEDSLGEVIETKNKKIKQKVWVAQGEALKLYQEQIHPQIEKLLHHIEPPQCAPLFLTLYMIGKTETSASPVIMISCRDRQARKDAEGTVRESCILQQFPQMGLGNSATLLEANASLVTSTGKVPESCMDDQSPSNFEIHWSEEPIIGRQLRLVDKADGGEIVRLATGGPFVQIERHMYQMTAFHIGQGDAGTGSNAQLDSDPDDCTYDGQSDTEEDGSGLEGATAKSTPLRDPISSTMETRTEPTSLSMTHHETDVVSEEHDGQDGWGPLSLFHRGNIDYSLARLPAEEASKASNTIGKSEKRLSLQVTEIGTPKPHTQVVVVTSYSLLTGSILPGTNRVKMNGYSGFQDLLTARLSSSIKLGDSGSAVVDATTGCLYGHIILGSAPDTIVYIVPSVNVFTDILAIFGNLPALNFTTGFPGPSETLQVLSNELRSGWQLPQDVSTGTLLREAKTIRAAKSTGTDPEYGVHPASYFKPGTVFQVVLSEPMQRHEPPDNMRSSPLGPPLGHVWNDLRQFIVIRNGEGHSSCVPIRTYDKLGCKKDGVSPQNHGIVYEKGSQPELLGGEPQLGFSPVCFTPSLRVHIGKEARADYGNLVTVVHDVGVMFIGLIANEDWPAVQQAVDSCCDANESHRSGHGYGHGRRREVKKGDKTTLTGAQESPPRDHGSVFRSSYSSRDTDELSRYSLAKWSRPIATCSTGYEVDSSTGSMWSTQQPIQNFDTKTKINSKGQFVTVINNKQSNRSDEPPPRSKWSTQLPSAHGHKSAMKNPEVQVNFTASQ